MQSATGGSASQHIHDNKFINCTDVTVGKTTQGHEDTHDIPTWLDTHAAKSAPLKQPNLHQTAGLHKVIQILQEGCVDGSSKTLLLHGYPGAGKTSAAYGIIQHLFSRYKDGIESAYMIFDHTRPSEHNCRKVLLRILRWFIGHKHRLNGERFDLVRSSYTKCHPRDSGEWLETPSECVDLMLETLSGRNTYVVLDAIDEFTDQEELHGLFEQLRRLQDGIGLRVILTNRYKEPPSNLLPALIHQISADDQDVENFVRDKFGISQKEALRSLRPEDKLQQRALRAISKVSCRIFLLVRLNVAYVCSARSRNDLTAIVEELENGQPSYDEPDADAAKALNRNMLRVFQQSNDKDRAEVRAIFACVLEAIRPLTAKELWSAVRCETDSTVVEIGDLGGSRDISQLTQGLVEENEHSATIEFISESLRHYLLQQPQWKKEFECSKWRLASSCVNYLCMPRFSQIGWCSNPGLLRARRKNYPFLEYAARYWFDHYKRLMSRPIDEIASQVRHTAFKFLRKSDNVSLAMQIILLPDPVLQDYQPDATTIRQSSNLNDSEASLAPVAGHTIYTDYEMTGLHLASLAGLSKLVSDLLDWQPHYSYLERETRRRETAVMFAACSGDVDTVETLVLRGARLNTQDMEGFTPICRAMSGGHSKVVCSLLKLDVGRIDPTIPITPPDAPPNTFQIRSSEVRIGFHGYSVNLGGYTVLHQAAVQGDEDVVQAWIGRRLGVDHADHDGNMPCHKAAKYGHLSVLKLLLDNSAFKTDPIKLRSSDGRTPLHLACKYGRSRVVEYLMQHFPDFGAIEDFRGNIPMHTAVDDEQPHIAQLLDHRLVSLRKKNDDGLTPLDLLERKPLEVKAHGTWQFLWDPANTDRQSLHPDAHCQFSDVRHRFPSFSGPSRSSTTSMSQYSLPLDPKTANK